MPAQSAADAVIESGEPVEAASAPAGRRTFRDRLPDLWWVLGLIAVAIVLAALRWIPREHSLWLSDSRFYLFFTLRSLGEDPLTAQAHVKAFFDTLALPADRNLWESANFPLFRGRPLYPLLSAPLVSVMGYGGMLVLPLLSWVALGPVLYASMRRLASRLAAGLGALLVLLSGVSIYLMMPMAEPFAMIGMAAWLMVLPWDGRTSWRRLVLCGLIVGLTEFVRPITFYIAIPVVLLALWSMRKPKEYRLAWWKTAAVSVVVVAITSVIVQRLVGAGVTGMLYVATLEKNPWKALGAYPAKFVKNFGAESLTALKDPPIMILLIGALLAAIVLRRTVASWLFVAGIVSYVGTYALAPYSTNLRTFLPGLVFIIAGMAMGVTYLQSRPRPTIGAAEPHLYGDLLEPSPSTVDSTRRTEPAAENTAVEEPEPDTPATDEEAAPACTRS